MLNKKIKKLLIGTNNKGKLKEIRALLPKKVKTLSASYFKLNSPKEYGKTFIENSIIKSKFFSKKANLICLADDSGLEIDLLSKKPGIYSARWAGKKSNFNKAIKKVYRELNKKDPSWKEKRKIRARVVCALSISYLHQKIVSAIGKIEGHISSEPKGDKGFGYDPIFIPLKKSKTFGEMDFKKKSKIDHRYRAFKKIKKFF